ncbi:MAG TPA: HypC/HybG/HupF family hydrogenase formation chaperone [Bryobacteraceae bacterium]|nr:HypC/HybG/HupF family hydrogenase formation chaperone [Bryobacteraceae bacterium]
MCLAIPGKVVSFHDNCGVRMSKVDFGGITREACLEYLPDTKLGASYDLGEALRLVLLSVTEGEDKPLKYPTIFHTADAAVVTKMDLAAAAEFDLEAALRNVEKVRPGMPVWPVSSKTGAGMEALRGFLIGEFGV